MADAYEINWDGKPCPDCGQVLKLQVCQSGSGRFYIGTWCCGQPMSRESVDYYGSRMDAQVALNSGQWTRRDTGYHPGSFIVIEFGPIVPDPTERPEDGN